MVRKSLNNYLNVHPKKTINNQSYYSRGQVLEDSRFQAVSIATGVLKPCLAMREGVPSGRVGHLRRTSIILIPVVLIKTLSAR